MFKTYTLNNITLATGVCCLLCVSDPGLCLEQYQLILYIRVRFSIENL